MKAKYIQFTILNTYNRNFFNQLNIFYTITKYIFVMHINYLLYVMLLYINDQFIIYIYFYQNML